MDLEECAVYDCNHGKQYYPGWLVDDFKNNVCNKQCPAADKNVSYYCGPDDLLSSQRPKFQAYGGVQELRGPAGVTSREITWHRGPRHHLKLHYAVVLAEEQHVVNLDDVEEIWRITCPAEDAQRMELDLISSREATTLREHFLSLLRSYQSLVVAGVRPWGCKNGKEADVTNRRAVEVSDRQLMRFSFPLPTLLQGPAEHPQTSCGRARPRGWEKDLRVGALVLSVWS